MFPVNGNRNLLLLNTILCYRWCRYENLAQTLKLKLHPSFVPDRGRPEMTERVLAVAREGLRPSDYQLRRSAIEVVVALEFTLFIDAFRRINVRQSRRRRRRRNSTTLVTATDHARAGRRAGRRRWATISSVSRIRSRATSWRAARFISLARLLRALAATNEVVACQTVAVARHATSSPPPWLLLLPSRFIPA